MVVYPDQPLDEEIRGCMIYGKATIDVRITRNNMDYFIRCVPGDVKAHTYPNGIVQTWKTFRDDYNGLRVGTPSEDAPQYEWNEVVCVEFIGRLYNRSLNINKLTGMSNYCISEFIVYYNELNE